MKTYSEFDQQLASLYSIDDFTRIIENFPVPICLFQMDENNHPHQFIYINQKAVDLMQLPKQEILTCTWKELFEIPVDRDLDELREETRKKSIKLKKSPLKRHMKGLALQVEPHPVELASGEIIMVVTIINITEHHQTQQQLQKSEQEFGSLFSNNPDIAFSLHLDGTITGLNKAGLVALDYEADEAIGMDVKQLIAESSLDWLKDYFYQVLKGETARFKTTIRSKDGRTLNVDITAIPVFVNDEITGLIGIAHEITEKVQMENLLKENEQRYKALFDYNINPVMTFDLEGKFLRVNEAAVTMIGYPTDELVGKSFLRLIDSSRRNESYQNFQLVLDGKPRQYETMVIGRDEKQHLLHVMLIPAMIDGELSAIHCVCKDITESRRNEDLANYMAYHDVLTSLSNQRLFQDELVLLTQEPHAEDEVSAVFLVDLDRFKFINDLLGHEAGDSVLREVADRLLACVEESGSVFRYAGDEFTVILRKTSEQKVTEIAQKVIEEMRKPLNLDGFEAVLTTSIGISLFPKDASDMKGLMRSSDMAMYHAKRVGRNNYQFYTTQIIGLTKNTLEIESLLHKALEQQEFTLHYQPQFEAVNEKLTGFEALIRWESLQLGRVSPVDFIPLAEENGLIVPIGEWVIREACKTNKRWQDQFGQFVPVSVNLSLRQFYQKDLVDQVASILQETGLDPRYLMLEITESIAMQEDAATRVLKELKALGVLIAMDDFGTGYSSLKHLRHFPIDHLKIDQAFVRDLDEENGEAIVAAIIALGHNLRIPIVAEGVETERQVDLLKGLGCDVFQGYYYARPQPVEQIDTFLQT